MLGTLKIRGVGARVVSYSALSLLVLLLVAFSGSPARAQGAVGSTRSDYGMGTGSHTIKGTIQLNDGSPIGDRRFKVHLESADQSTRDANTDLDGNYSFNSVPSGNWSVVVEPTNEYEGARESAPIDRSAGSPVNIVNVLLRRKLASDPAFAGVPKGALEAYSKGMQALEKKDDKKAEELFNKAVTGYPDFAQALTELGALYVKQNNYAKAIETLQKAVKIKPDSYDAHFNYGAALFYNKDYAGAEPEFRTAVKLRETSAIAHMYLGMVVVRLKKYDEAREEFEKAINLPGGDGLAQAHYYLGGLYFSSDPKRAADELEKYLQLQPKAADAEKTRQAIKDLRAKAGG